VQVLSRGKYRLCKFQRGRRFTCRQGACLVVLTVVMRSWDASYVHCVKVVVRLAGSSGSVGGVEG
jgi:hypothetical protein